MIVQYIRDGPELESNSFINSYNVYIKLCILLVFIHFIYTLNTHIMYNVHCLPKLSSRTSLEVEISLFIFQQLLVVDPTSWYGLQFPCLNRMLFFLH